MNRFRTKRRAKDDSSAPEQSSMPSFKGFRRGKKLPEEEPKKEFDLTSALPSDDNFRTSLLMTNLSARFSMLREQDDPNTKIGKASDDSVLIPNRQSRLAGFGFTTGLGGLSDIAEVESIKAPFLRGEINSYISDDADSTRGGNMMNRCKPTEGNVLFGGRQKIYKIPAGASSSAKGTMPGGMGGRALYDDDVAVSAFQLWRQSEKQRRPTESEKGDPTNDGPDGDVVEASRSDSPPLMGYNRKRETSSTTSSSSVVARYSTAATSITSQPATLARDPQAVATTYPSAHSTPVLERSVTRTRRLYEQALTQDMHDQQSSALSRIDTLGRQRAIGSRTPDLAQVSPSPTNLAFHERFGERRPILSKASAPNLRSFSPPATASSSGTLDFGIKEANQPDDRTAFGGSPPLSPPISETGDHSSLSIQPNDRGKATAMGVFQKPAEPYDESRYAQRQMQLQLGRDTPTSRIRAESSASFSTTGRSTSSSSMQRQPLEAKTESNRRMEPTVREEYGNDGTFLDDSDDSGAGSGKRLATPQVVLQRPADRDHPAFREPALPTPPSVSDARMGETSRPLANTDATYTPSRQGSPPDSPTLGPISGLSGMVRHHLRSESNTSSVYGGGPQTAGLEARFYIDPHDSVMQGLGGTSNPWTADEQDWNLTDSVGRGQQHISELPGDGNSSPANLDRHSLDRLSGDEMESETDGFANQLADARRRVRERLTSYVETDSSREGSPLRHADPRKDTGQPQQLNALGIGMLKPKSSRGSLIDRSRTMVGGQLKPMKMLGIGAATMATSPSPSTQSFDKKDTSLASTQEEPKLQRVKTDQHDAALDVKTETDSKSLHEKEDENIHPGLRAFRQARRELQRRKELDTLAKHQTSQTSASGSERADRPSLEQSSPGKGRTGRPSSPSRERKPPPVFYQQRTPSDESGHSTTSHPGSRQASTERDRSGSEASNGRSDGRPARLRNNSTPHNVYQQHQQLEPNHASRQPMLRSPGLPGTDIRRSPIMPPQGYPGSAQSSAMSSPKYFDRSHSATNLTVQPPRYGHGSSSGQPSPISPLGDPLALYVPSPAPSANVSPSTMPTTKGTLPRRPSAPQSPVFNSTTSTMNDSHKRAVNKRDISEPTFVMSTSRVPTVSLLHSPPSAEASSGFKLQSSTRARAGSTTGQSAPPLPPINPLRKREGSGTKDVIGQFFSARSDQDYTSNQPGVSQLSNVGPPQGPNGLESAGRRRGMGDSDTVPEDHSKAFRNTLAANGAQSPGYWAHSTRQQGPSPFTAAGPPASRTVLTPGLKHSKAGAPGGMF